MFNYQTAGEILNTAVSKEKAEEKGENKLEIPALEISAPIISSTSTAESDIKKDLDIGVVLFPDSARPGEGQSVILGHSAPEGWPHIKYQWVFSDLNDLEEGDEIVVHWEGEKFVYKVEETLFIDKGALLPEEEEGENTLIMISCWPPGKNLRRIAVVSSLQ